MAQYKIFFNTSASTEIEVEADSYDEAVDKAWAEGFPGICAQCAGMGYSNGPGIELGDEWEPDEFSYYRDGEYVSLRDEEGA